MGFADWASDDVTELYRASAEADGVRSHSRLKYVSEQFAFDSQTGYLALRVSNSPSLLLRFLIESRSSHNARGSTSRVRSSLSSKCGMAPAWRMTFAVAAQLRAGVSTSSARSTTTSTIDKCSAALVMTASSASNRSTNLPTDETNAALGSTFAYCDSRPANLGC